MGPRGVGKTRTSNTVVSDLSDTLIAQNKQQRVKLLRSQFKKTMGNWTKTQRDSGLRKSCMRKYVYIILK